MRRDDRGLLWFALGFFGITALAVSMDALADVGVTWPAPEGTHFRYGMTGSSSGAFTNCNAHQYNPSAFHDCARTIVAGTFCMAWRAPTSTWTGGPGISDLYVIGDRGYQSACGEGWTRWYQIRQFVEDGPCPGGETCGAPEPPPLDCTPFIGQKLPMDWPSNESAPTCALDVDGYGCSITMDAVTVSVGGMSFNVGIISGETCSPPNTDSNPDSPPVSCIEDGGQQHCTTTDDPGCGYVNGERWCPPINSDFVITAQGAIIANDGVSPVVDSQGNPVAPDSTVSAGGDTYNYYSSSTVSSNTINGVGSGNSAQSGSGIPGAGSSGDGGPGSPDGTNDEGDGDGEFNGPGTGEVETFQEAQARMDGDVSNTWDIMDAQGFLWPQGGIPSPVGAACPGLAFSAFGSEISSTLHCDIVDEHKSYLQIMFLFIWGLASARIVLSA